MAELQVQILKTGPSRTRNLYRYCDHTNGCSDTESIVITQDITVPTAAIANPTGTNELTCLTTAINVVASGEQLMHGMAELLEPILKTGASQHWELIPLL
ncbi:MAG: hypothetical protein IPH45_14555 [Bacteroidales bacterium]|nr:hypothetical protein [Bacteroidales bacterium]